MRWAVTGVFCCLALLCARLACAQQHALAPEPRTFVTAGSWVCLVDAKHEVYCWLRTVGAGTGPAEVHNDMPSFARVAGLSNVVELEAKTNYLCARTSQGEVQCWGCSKNGSCRWWPKRIELTRPAAQLAVALDGACARLDNGSVQCWGDYAPTTPNRGTPDPKAAEVTGLRDVVQLTAAGSERCALDRQGQVSCWTLARPTPTRVAGLERVAAIAAGRSFTCAIVEPQRDVRCWGLPETAGVVRIPQLDHVRQIALGHSFGVALTDAGAVYHWGPYQYGEGATKQAAANATQFPLEPVRAASHLKVRKLVVTGSTTCFELESGELTCERIMSKLPFHIREVLPAVTFDMGPPR